LSQSTACRRQRIPGRTDGNAGPSLYAWIVNEVTPVERHQVIHVGFDRRHDDWDIGRMGDDALVSFHIFRCGVAYDAALSPFVGNRREAYNARRQRRERGVRIAQSYDTKD